MNKVIVVVSLFVTGISLAVIAGYWGAHFIEWLRDRF